MCFVLTDRGVCSCTRGIGAMATLCGHSLYFVPLFPCAVSSSLLDGGLTLALCRLLLWRFTRGCGPCCFYLLPVLVLVPV